MARIRESRMRERANMDELFRVWTKSGKERFLRLIGVYLRRDRAERAIDEGDQYYADRLRVLCEYYPPIFEDMPDPARLKRAVAYIMRRKRL